MSCSSSEVCTGLIWDNGGVIGDWLGNGEMKTPEQRPRNNSETFNATEHSLIPSFFKEAETENN